MKKKRAGKLKEGLIVTDKIKAKNRSFVCSNSKCKGAFANPIIVQNLNSKNPGSYSACPYCFTKMVMEEAFKVEEKSEMHPVQTKPVQQSCSEKPRCPHGFGYLSQRSSKEEIPEECMMCDKMMDCILFKLREGNT